MVWGSIKKGISTAAGGELGSIVGGIAGDFAGAAGTENTFKAKTGFQDGGFLSGAEGAFDISAQTEENKNQLTEALANRNQQGVSFQPQMGVASSLAGFGGQQMGATPEAAQRLYGLADRQGPSVAQMQLQQGLEDSIAASRAQAASAQGVSPAMAARLAQRGAESAQSSAVRDAGFLRAQEENNQLARALQAYQGAGSLTQGAQALGVQAMQGAGSIYGQATGQDIQQQSQLDDMTKFYTSAGLSLDAAQQQAQQDLWKMKQEQFNAAQGINAGVAAGNQAAHNQLVGGVMQGISGGVGMLAGKSDKRAKKNIKPGDEDIDDFLGKLSPSKYRYKNPNEDGHGDRYSVMAQELLKSKVGKTFVKDTPRGLMVDYGSGLGAMLAAQARLNKRIGQLEKKRAA